MRNSDNGGIGFTFALGFIALTLFILLQLGAFGQPTPSDTTLARGFNGETQDTSKIHKAGHAMWYYYNFALENVIKDIKHVDFKTFPLSKGNYICHKPKKVKSWMPTTMKTLSQPLPAIHLAVGFLGAETGAFENGIAAIQVMSHNMNLLLVPIGKLPDSYQAGKLWENYLAINMYENAGVGAYLVISICNSVSTEIVIGSTMGQLGWSKNKTGWTPLHRIYGANQPYYSEIDRFYGTFEYINPTLR